MTLTYLNTVRVFVIAVVLSCDIMLVNIQHAAAAVTQQQVSAFLASPEKTLDEYSSDTARFTTLIRDLALFDTQNTTVLDAIIALLKKIDEKFATGTEKDQEAARSLKSAVGSGLGQAARIAVRTNQDYANDIQAAISRTKDQDAVLAYALVTGNQPIAALVGPGGAVGGQTSPLPGNPSGTGAPQPIGAHGVNTPQFSYSSSVAPLGQSVSVF
jgi:hypothetical protein